VTQADLDAGSVTNIASVSGAPSGVKRALNTDFAAVGDVLDYEYDVTNTGNVTITDPITVSDDKITTVSCPALPASGLTPNATLTCSASYSVVQADLDAGESVVCTGEYTVTQVDLDAGQVTNLASATGTPSGGVLTPAETSETVSAERCWGCVELQLYGREYR